MKKVLVVLLGIGIAACNTPGTAGAAAQAKEPNEKVSENHTDMDKQQAQEQESLHNFTAQTLEGESFDFAELKGKRVLIVNTASECGYTPQYEKLQELYSQYGGEDFTIIGFPSNDFGKQEPGSDEEIKEFCEKNYGVEFPMMSKTSVTGENKHPVYDWLTHKKRNGRKDVEVQWNFNKFLVNENGEWFAYFPSDVDPMDERIVNFARGEEKLEKGE